MKTTLGEAIRRVGFPTFAMKDPIAGHARTTDLRQISQLFSDTLLHLAGPVDLQPNDSLVTELLSRSPQCPPEVQSTPIADICKTSPTAQIVLQLFRGYHPRVNLLEADAASSLAHTCSTSRRPLTSKLSIHRDCEIQAISLRAKQQMKESMYKGSEKTCKTSKPCPG